MAKEDSGAPSQPVLRWRDALLLACAHYGLAPGGNVSDGIAAGYPVLSSKEQTQKQAAAVGWLGEWVRGKAAQPGGRTTEAVLADNAAAVAAAGDDDFAPDPSEAAADEELDGLPGTGDTSADAP